MTQTPQYPIQNTNIEDLLKNFNLGKESTFLTPYGGNANNLYEVLGIPETDDLEIIKKAYKAQSRRTHPDANPDNPDMEGLFKQVTEAYRVLSNPSLKENYDAFNRIKREQSLLDNFFIPSSMESNLQRVNYVAFEKVYRSKKDQITQELKETMVYDLANQMYDFYIEKKLRPYEFISNPQNKNKIINNLSSLMPNIIDLRDYKRKMQQSLGKKKTQKLDALLQQYQINQLPDNFKISDKEKISLATSNYENLVNLSNETYQKEKAKLESGRTQAIELLKGKIYEMFEKKEEKEENLEATFSLTNSPTDDKLLN